MPSHEDDLRTIARIERQYLEPPDDERDDAMTACTKPGRYGCGNCDACEYWADRQADL
jgi:hypothetical protein